ncbi:MAG: hypothetical protein AB8B86_16240 [Pseudomonadales bacterium]
MVEIVSIEENAVIIEAAGLKRAINAGTVIVAGSPQPDTSLAEVISKEGIRVQSIGDSTGLGLIVKATSTAAEAVANIH